MDHDEIVRLYGPWTPHSPSDVVDLLTGYIGEWWIAGGWAIEAFTGHSRPHGDVDPSIPRGDVGMLRDHVRGRLDVWAADQGSLRPVLDERSALTATCSNLWLRRDGAAPWEYDVILMDAADGRWTYKRDSRIGLPFDEILWVKDGIRYLRPEIQLLHKAPGLRPVDQADFDAARPLLDPSVRDWLRAALDLAHPGHPWAAQLG